MITEDAEMSESSEQFDESIVQELITSEGRALRKKARQNKAFNAVISLDRNMLEYARRVGNSHKLPPRDWIEKQLADGCFPTKFKKYTINFREIVLDETRHGFAPVDVPLDRFKGIRDIHDLSGCVASPGLRNVYVLENCKAPVCRFGADMFCQKWISMLIHPKFVFRGLIACPKGDYGLARVIIEVGDTEGRNIKNEIAIPFKRTESENFGQFVPFEVETKPYSFNAIYCYVYVCMFYVDQVGLPVPGFRMANCNVQCVLPPVIDRIKTSLRDEALPGDVLDHPPYRYNFMCEFNKDSPGWVDQKKAFFSVFINAKRMKDEELERSEEEIRWILGQDILDDKMEEDEEQAQAEKRKTESDPEQEPIVKKPR